MEKPATPAMEKKVWVKKEPSPPPGTNAIRDAAPPFRGWTAANITPAPAPAPAPAPVSAPAPVLATTPVTASVFAPAPTPASTLAPAPAPVPPQAHPASSPYASQFSTSTTLILNRIRNQGSIGQLDPSVGQGHEAPGLRLPALDATFEEVKSRLKATLQASSFPATPPGQKQLAPLAPRTPLSPLALTMAIPPSMAQARPSPLHANSVPSVLPSALKRKRGPLHDGADEEASLSGSTSESNAETAVAAEARIRTVAPRLVLRKRKGRADGVPRCEKCDRTASTPSNVLLTCNSCEGSWHQKCHEPELGASAARAPQGGFRCAECTRALEEHARLVEAYVERTQSRRQQEIARLRERRLASLPRNAVIGRPELVGFPAGSATPEDRVKYFSAMRKEDLLSLLSFADALQPHLLIDVLTSVSRRHPDLPIFNSPDWAAAYHPEDSAASSSTPAARSHHGAAATPSQHASSPAGRGKQRHKSTTTTTTPTQKKVQSRGAAETLPTPAAADLNEQDDPFAVPPSWPAVGRGLYSVLPPEVYDSHILAEDNDEAFSHFLVDAEGRPVAAAG